MEPSRGAPGRRAGALAVLLVAGACAHAPPVAPPPMIDYERLEQARKRQPALTAEVELLEWRARELAGRGELDAAERSARLARELLATIERLPEPEPLRASDGDVASASASAGEPSSSSERTDRRRRRRRPRPSAPEAASVARPEPSPEPSPLEQRMQALALALRRVAEGRLDADGRVWVDAAQRALIDAQRALASGAPERARQHLDRVTDALSAVGPPGGEIPGEPGSGEGQAARPALDPLEALEKDLAGAELEVVRRTGWLFVPLPEARNPASVIRRQRERLQVLGRLLRVYGAARPCVGTGPEVASEAAEQARGAITTYLEGVEKIDPDRFLACPEGPVLGSVESSSSSDGAGGAPFRLYVGLTFGSGRRS